MIECRLLGSFVYGIKPVTSVEDQWMLSGIPSLQVCACGQFVAHDMLVRTGESGHKIILVK